MEAEFSLGSPALLSTLQTLVYTVFIVSSAKGGYIKQKSPVLTLLQYLVYRCAQIQSHWNHWHLPTALLEIQWHAESTCVGTLRPLLRRGKGDRCRRTKAGYWRMKALMDMAELQPEYRKACTGQSGLTESGKDRWFICHAGCSPPLALFRKCHERIPWLSVGFLVGHTSEKQIKLPHSKPWFHPV